MNKFTIGVIIVILAVFGGMIIYSSTQNKENTIDYSKFDASKIITDTTYTGGIEEHVRGKADSKVVVVEYADFQCPGCASMMPKVDKVYEEFKDEVAFVFRSYPLSYHQNARAASAAAEAANEQGLFWEMADALYTNRLDWINESGSSRSEKFIDLFKSIAPEGDLTKFINDLNNNEYDKKIDFDFNLGKKVSKVTATPSLHVNGEHVPIDEQDSLDDYADKLRAKIKEELAKE